MISWALFKMILVLLGVIVAGGWLLYNYLQDRQDRQARMQGVL